MRNWSLTRMLDCPLRSPPSCSSLLPGGTARSFRAAAESRKSSFLRAAPHRWRGQARRARGVFSQLNRSSVPPCQPNHPAECGATKLPGNNPNRSLLDKGASDRPCGVSAAETEKISKLVAAIDRCNAFSASYPAPPTVFLGSAPFLAAGGIEGEPGGQSPTRHEEQPAPTLPRPEPPNNVKGGYGRLASPGERVTFTWSAHLMR